MKKFFLTFKNANIEEQYQQTCIGQTRMKMFQLIILTFLIVFSIRAIQCLLENNTGEVITNIIFMAFLILLYLITRRYQKIIRISLFLVNHVFTIYLLLIEESSDPYSSYLRGANQMGTNLLLIFSGEFLDGVISLISLSTIKVIIVFIKSSDFEYFMILVGIQLVGYASIQLHEYHKGFRAQFLLSINEKQWDNVFAKIIKDIPYLILTFDDECLKYEVQSIENCEKIISNKEEVTLFLKNSTKTGQTLELLLYKKIKSFQSQFQENLNNVTNICINKKKLLLEYSIFKGNKPIILCIFKDIQEQYHKNIIQKKQHIQSSQFFEFFFKLCLKLQKTEDKNYYLKQVQRKLLVVQQIQNFQLTKFHLQNLNLKKFFHQLLRLYPNKIIFYNTLCDIEIETIIQLLKLFFLNLMECLQSQQALIHFKINVHQLQYLELFVMGQFDQAQLNQINEKFNYLFNLIIENLQIRHECKKFLYKDIKFRLLCSAYVPFTF